MARAAITLSIVSHGQPDLAERLLSDLSALGRNDIEVVYTANVPERRLMLESFGLPMRVVRNDAPRGFGANHNAAFRLCRTPYFCVLNPDISLVGDPFEPLLAECRKPGVGVVAPLVVDMRGECEDSARRFPTLGTLARKALSRKRALDYGVPSGHTISPDWVAGMFMLFPSEAFRAVGGFDERFYLYYEDVALCRRLRQMRLDVRLVQSVCVRHLARRESHRNLRYLLWHMESMTKYFLLARWSDVKTTDAGWYAGDDAYDRKDRATPPMSSSANVAEGAFRKGYRR